MCELTSIPYSVFLLPKKDALRKKKLLEQPKIKKGSNSNLLLNKSIKNLDYEKEKNS
jgi:hypothetical protein